MPQTLPSYLAAAASVEVVLADGAPKTRVQLLPLGTVPLRDGRGPFLVRDANKIIAATRARAGRTAIAVDYDHQSVFGARDGVGGRAPAAGWIDPASLRAEADGIYGDVEWTPAGSEALLAREYRYISPLFSFDQKSKAVLAIVNAGLTNTPAIESLAAVASQDAGASLFASSQPETLTMSFASISAALGLAAAATEEEIVAAIGVLAEKSAVAASAIPATALAAAASTFGLTADATLDQLLAAAAAKPDPAQYVPIAVVADLQKSVSELQKTTADEKADAMVAAAMRQGKVTPKQKDWASDYAKSDLAGFSKYLEGAPVLVAAGTQFEGLSVDPDPASDGLTPAEAKVAASMGVSPESYLQAKKDA